MAVKHVLDGHGAEHSIQPHRTVRKTGGEPGKALSEVETTPRLIRTATPKGITAATRSWDLLNLLEHATATHGLIKLAG